MNEAAFRKLQQEITFVPLKVKLPPSIRSSDKGEYQALQRNGSRSTATSSAKSSCAKAGIPRIDPADFSVTGWTERSYYEICTDPAIYAALEKKKAAKA